MPRPGDLIPAISRGHRRHGGCKREQVMPRTRIFLVVLLAAFTPACLVGEPLDDAELD